MVKAIFLSSLAERAGKSYLAIGMMQKLQKEGKKVAYFKPIGVSRYEDTVSITSVDVSQVMGISAPVSISDNYYIDLINKEKKEEYLKKIKKEYDELAKNMDYIVVEGRSLLKFSRIGLDDVTIAKLLHIDGIFLIETASNDKIIDNLYFTMHYIKYRDFKIKGVIFNQIDFDYIPRIEELKENHIKRYDIPVLGVLEKKFSLNALRASEILNGIGGELLNQSTSEGLNNIVETYVIGAMNTTSALKHMRKVKKAALITGGDRADLALAALSEDTSCIILTGFIQPDVKIITVANEKGIPIILSPSDTYTTMRNIERVRPAVQQDEILLALTLVEELDWKEIMK
ncbi:MAG: phosphotransacetylase family protein [archaeon]|nr:phosphotransacetylase family protein [archaeon]